MSESYKISLGVDVDVSDIQSQINSKATKIDKVPIKLEIENLKEIKKQIQSLGDTKANKGLLTFNTESLEASLKDVSIAIKDIKASIGTLDSGSGMKSLLSSINQISTALEKASNQFSELNVQLKTLSSKDFSVNVGLNMGGSNPVARNAAYGSKVRNETLPQLRQQAEELENYLKQYYKVADGFNAAQKLIQGTNAGKGKANLYDILPKMLDSTGSLSSQMTAVKEYIALIKEAASIKGGDVGSGINDIISGFSQSADKLVKDAQDVQTGVNETRDALKGLFGGSGIDADGLTKQLDSIVIDLSEIKTVIQSLSSNNSLDGLTQSFNRLSETLEKLTSNLTLAKNTLDTGFSNASPANNAVKIAQQTSQKIGEAVEKSAKQSINLDDVIDEQVSSLMNEYAIAGKKGSKAFDEIRQSLVDFRNGSGDINKVTSAISNNMKVVNEAKNDYKELADYIRMFNASGAKVHIPDSIRQEYGDDYKSMRSQLGKGFTSGQGMDFETFIVETNSILGDTIDLSHGAEAAFGDLVNKVNSTKGGKFLTGDDLFRNGILDMGDVVANVSTSLEKIENAEEEIARTSTTTANTVSNISDSFKEVDIAIGTTEDQLDNLNKVLRSIGFDKSSVDAITKEFEELDITVKKVTSRLNSDGSVKLTLKGVDRSGNDVTSLNNITDDGTLSSWSTSITKSFDEVEQSFKRLKSLAKEIGQLDIKIAGLNIDKNADEIYELATHLNKLKTEYSELYLATSKDLSDGQIDALSQEFINAGNKIDTVKAKLVDVRNELAKGIKTDIELGNFENQVDEMYAKFNRLSDANIDLRNSVKDVEVAYKAMLDAADANTGDEIADREKLIQAEKRYAEALEKTNNLIKIQARADKIDADNQKLIDDRQVFQSKIDTWLTKNSAATSQFGNAMLKLKAQAESCDRVTLNHLAKQFTKLDNLADKAGLKMENLGDRIKSKFKEYSAYISVAEVFMHISQAMRDMFEQVKLIDSAMTELKKVTDESDASYNQFLSNAATRAKEIGTTIDGFVTSTADFARLGYGFNESQELAEVANIYAVVGDEIDGVEGATESLISTMTAFGIEASNSMSIVDKFNIIGNNFAISSGGIGEALERSASSMAAANNSLDETIALITAANTVVQDPASVGQAFKTISMRIRGAKTE